MELTIYEGFRIDPTRLNTVTGRRTTVLANGKNLKSEIIKSNDSASVFDWRYMGVRPLNLSKSILADHFGTNEIPNEITLMFAVEVIMSLEDEWTLTSDDIELFLQETYGDLETDD